MANQIYKLKEAFIIDGGVKIKFEDGFEGELSFQKLDLSSEI